VAPLEAVVSEWDWLLYPLALWSMAGVVVLVTMLNMVIALIMAHPLGA
jgi:hypothetical protein